MHPAGVAILVIILFLLAGGGGWIIFTRLRAQRLGLPSPPFSSYLPFVKSSATPYGPPQPAPGGVVGWFNDRVRAFKNRNNRTAAGAYEQSGNAAPGGRRGFGPLDPDDAWDSRVGHDPYGGPGGYYEEQELGLTNPRVPGGGANVGQTIYSGGHSGSSYQMNLATGPDEPVRGRDEETRGRTRSRSPAPGLASNPFGDTAEPSNMSLRGVSPRPVETSSSSAAGNVGQPKDEDSPTGRRSMFRENM